LLVNALTLIAQAPISDVYAVYSVLLQDTESGLARSNDTYLIDEITGTFYPELDPRVCQGFEQRHKQAVAEVMADYAARKSDRARIEARFDAGKPYKLVPREEAQKLFEGLSEHVKPAPGSIHIIRLSNVYFSKDHSLAMVLLSQHCGRLCGQKTIYFFERKKAWTWDLLKSPKCPMMIS